MELELLKEQWERMNKRVQHSELLNQRLVHSIISSRVLTTVDKIKRTYFSFYLVLSLEIVFLIALFIGNPFDFRYQVQFVPYVLIFVGVIIAFLNLVQIHRRINRLSPAGSIGDYLRKIVAIYDTNKRFEKSFGVILFFIAASVPFSFLPHKLARMGVAGALLDTAIMTSVSLVLFLLAYKLGAFRNRHKEKLSEELKEWEELKSLTNSID